MDISSTAHRAQALNTPTAAAANIALDQPVAAQNELEQRLTAAAVKFESFFVAQMMKQMRQATAAIADAGSAINKQVNDSTLALAEQAVSDGLAGQRAFGIADVLVKQMLPQTPLSVDAATTRKFS